MVMGQAVKQSLFVKLFQWLERNLPRACFPTLVMKLQKQKWWICLSLQLTIHTGVKSRNIVTAQRCNITLRRPRLHVIHRTWPWTAKIRYHARLGGGNLQGKAEAVPGGLKSNEPQKKRTFTHALGLVIEVNCESVSAFFGRKNWGAAAAAAAVVKPSGLGFFWVTGALIKRGPLSDLPGGREYEVWLQAAIATDQTANLAVTLKRQNTWFSPSKTGR